MAINQLQHAHGLLVYPSDVYTLSYQFNSTTQSSNLYVGTGGNIRVLTAGGDDITFYNVQSGSFLPVHASKVFLTGTTASNILAMDMNLTGGGMNQETFAYLSATGITGDTEVSAINTLVSSLKLNGLWSKMKAVYPFVTDNRNLLSYTEDFGNAVWLQSNVTTTTNTTTAPNGTTTADTLNEGTTTGWHRLVYDNSANGITVTNGQTYTYSIYVKANTETVIQLNTYNIYASTSFNHANFDLQNGVIGTYANCTPNIQSVGNGWYRCSITQTSVTSGVAYLYATFANNNASASARPSYTGASKTLYLWGAQLELGSSATTYQPIATTQQSYISNQFKYNLVNPVDSDAAFRGVFNGGWTFSNQGALPNGTNGYMDTKLVPSSVLAQNSAHLSFYSRVDNVGSYVDMGATDASSRDTQLATRFTGNVNYSIITSGGGIPAMTETSSLSLAIASRTISTEVKIYRGGTFLKTQTNTSGTPVANNLYLSSRNNAGVAQLFSNRQCAFASIGDGLTDSEATALYNAVQTFNSTLNRAVAP